MSVDINWSILTSSSDTNASANANTNANASTDDPEERSNNNNKTFEDNSCGNHYHYQQQQQQQQQQREQSQDGSLAESVRDFLDARFQQITLPPFLNAVRVTAFDFGSVPPEIVVRDVCEPLGEFYEDDDDEEGGDDEDYDTNDDGELDGENEHKGNAINEEGVTDTNVSRDGRNNAVVKPATDAGFDATATPTATVGTTNTAGEGITTAAINRLNLSNLKLPIPSSSAGAQSLPSPFYDFHFPGAGGTSGLNTPQLSVAGTHTPGIPGGASNLGYFHLPLSAGLSGTVPGPGLGPGSVGATTPMMAVAGMGMGMGSSSTGNAKGLDQRRREEDSVIHQNLQQQQQQHRRKKEQRRKDERGIIREKSSSVKSNAGRISPRTRQRKDASWRRKSERRRDGTARAASNEDVGHYKNYSDRFSSSRSSNSSDSDDSVYRNRGRRWRRRRRRSISSKDSTSSSNVSTSAGASTSSIPAPCQPSPNDVQIVAHVRYSGDVRVSLTAEIMLDYPMPSFVSIPLKLNITGLVFDGTAVLAYVQEQLCQQVRRQKRNYKRGFSPKGRKSGKEDKGKEEQKKDSKRVHFCFLALEDTQTLYPTASLSDLTENLPRDGGEKSNGEDEHNQDRHTAFGYSSSAADSKIVKVPPVSISTTQNHNTIQIKDSDNNSPLHALRIESEIGQGENGKQVLKNVGKVERFVLEQVRRVFEEELVFPSYWTFLV